MSKQQIVVIRTLVEYTRKVVDANLQPITNGPVTYRIVTTLPDGKPMGDDTITAPDDRAFEANALKRGATTWDHNDIIEVEGI